MDKSLKKLSRVELLELMVDLSDECDELIAENNQLRRSLSQHRLPRNAKVGSIAEAALQANGYFESVQRSADEYLREIKYLRDELALRSQRSPQEARAVVSGAEDEVLSEARAEAHRILKEANAQARKIVEQAQGQARTIAEEAQMRANQRGMRTAQGRGTSGRPTTRGAARQQASARQVGARQQAGRPQGGRSRDERQSARTQQVPRHQPDERQRRQRERASSSGNASGAPQQSSWSRSPRGAW